VRGEGILEPKHAKKPRFRQESRGFSVMTIIRRAEEMSQGGGEEKKKHLNIKGQEHPAGGSLPSKKKRNARRGKPFT